MAKLGNKRKRLGILGGTFNPPHNGHLLMAEGVREFLGLEKVIFIPSNLPPHKELKDLLSCEDRANMVKFAIKGNPNFLFSDLELKRDGKSYTVDTLRELRKIYKGTELFFIIGSDGLYELDKWKDIDKIIKMCKLVVVKRPWYPVRVDRLRKKKTGKWGKWLEKMIFVEVPTISVSSTYIRESLYARKSLKYLLPEGVLQYINRKGLYRREK